MCEMTGQLFSTQLAIVVEKKYLMSDWVTHEIMVNFVTFT
jgi:hypothetical protein